jgi:hypothetical protein
MPDNYRQAGYANFLAAAIGVAKTVTKVNGTDFTSVQLPVQIEPASLLTVTFTRAAGSASLVTFVFQVSYDGGTTWSNFIDPLTGLEAYFSLATNHAVISGTTVRVSKPIGLYGVTHIRLASVANADASNDLTAVNASLSI